LALLVYLQELDISTIGGGVYKITGTDYGGVSYWVIFYKDNFYMSLQMYGTRVDYALFLDIVKQIEEKI